MAEIQAPTLDDPKDSWLVYADALQAAGDPRGELVALNSRLGEGVDTSTRDAYLDQHAAALFGSLAPLRAKLDIDWAYCVPRTLALKLDHDDDVRALFQALLTSPLAASMQTLRVVGQSPGYSRVRLGPGLALLAQNLAPSCTTVELVDERAERSRIMVSSDYEPDRNLVDFGGLDAIWAIPHLQRLRLWVADTQQVALGTIHAPQLREFAFRGLRWDEPFHGNGSAMGQTLAEAHWPELRHLALRIPETFTYHWPGQDGAYIPVDRYDEPSEYGDYGDDGWNEPINWTNELRGLFESLAATPLEHLSLNSFASNRNLLEALASLGLPSTLRTLDLSESDLNQADVEWMVEQQALFAGLDTLDLRDTLIEDPEPLSALAPTVLHSAGGGSIYRFSVGME